MSERVLINLASVDIVQIKKDNKKDQAHTVHITTRGSNKISAQHEPVRENKKRELLDSTEVIIYEPATGSKESLFDFVEREMLGKYEIQGRTGKVKYIV